MTGSEKSQAPLILVLLAVYKGEKYLREQVDSILAQTHDNLRLICRDDGSSDASVNILQSYVESYPEKIILLQDQKGNLGASGSFSGLMQWALEQSVFNEKFYVALSDQDDIWHREKLQKCLAAAIAAENGSPDIPILVHSDLRVIDADGREIAPSLVRYQGLDPDKTQFSAQLIRNTVTGCTSLMNMELLKKALPVPPEAMMHDWWLSLSASAFGRIIFLPDTLVEYRQHGRNTLGAREHKSASFDWQTFVKIFQIKKSVDVQLIFEKTAAQATAFESRFKNEIDAKTRQVIQNVVLLPRRGLWHQRLLFRRLLKE